MPSSAEILHYVTMTNAINEQKAPNSFLKNTFFGRNITVPTRVLELSYMRRGRQIAPFVERNGAAIMVSGRTEEFVNVQPPHIRIKRPMTPSDLLNKRRPGNVIFAGENDINRAMRDYMAGELEMMMDDITNSEEYLCSMALTGVISYIAQDESAFTVTMPRSPSHTIILTGPDLWTASTSNPRGDIADAMEIVNDDVGLNITDAVMGRNAADAFLANPQLMLPIKTSVFIAGTVDLTQQLQENGALYMGMYTNGVRLWRYGRKVNVGGIATDLIRPDYVEFLCKTPAAEMVTYYGGIEDMKALGAGKILQSQRFSKSWEEEDPSARMVLVESNPLPCLRRPDTTLSMKVT